MKKIICSSFDIVSDTIMRSNTVGCDQINKSSILSKLSIKKENKHLLISLS